jgi:hypothetical protein
MKHQNRDWQILVKWNETTDEYINMVVRGPLKTKAPVRRFHVTVNSQTGELCRNSDAKRLSRFEKAVRLALNTANEVSEAKRLLKQNFINQQGAAHVKTKKY